VCAPCLTSHAYCCEKCREKSRKDSRKRANKKYAGTKKGKKNQYERNQRYRKNLANQGLQAIEEKKVTDQTLTDALDCSSISVEAPFDSFDPEKDNSESIEPCIEECQDSTVNFNRDAVFVRDSASNLNICSSCGVTIKFLYPYLDELGSLRPETVKNQRSLRRGGLSHDT